MRKSTVGISMLFMALLTLTIAPTSTQQSGTYDAWKDLNDDGVIDAADLFELSSLYGTSGEPINRTELLLDLQDRMSNIEEQTRQARTIRYCDPTEHFWNQYEWTTLASFTWTPENPTENAILSVTYFFEYNASINISTEEVYFNVMIDGWTYPEPFTIQYNQIPVPHGYVWSPVLTLQYLARPIMGVPHGVKPNAPSHQLEFRICVRHGYMNIWVKNINIIIEVVDGLSAEN